MVLAYGTEGLHQRLVESLLADGLPAGNLVVVHNPAKQDDPGIPTPPLGVAVLRTDRNLGYAGGMNEGIRHFLATRLDWLLLLTNDVRFHEGAVQQLLTATTKSEGYGLLGSAMRWTDGRLYYGGRRDKMGRLWFRWEPPSDPVETVEVDWIPGSVLLVHREVFEQIGLLDERFFMYFEEAELCLRATRAGWRIGVVPMAIAEQQYGRVKRPALYSYLMARNGPEYTRRAVGLRGIAIWLWRELPSTWELLKAWKGRRSNPHQRRQARARLLATWQGTAAFFAQRWGVPPSWLWNESSDDPTVQMGEPTQQTLRS